MFSCFDDCVLFFFLYWIWGELYTVHIWGRPVNGRSIDGVWTWTNLGGERITNRYKLFNEQNFHTDSQRNGRWDSNSFWWPPFALYISFPSTSVNMEHTCSGATPYASLIINHNSSFRSWNQHNHHNHSYFILNIINIIAIIDTKWPKSLLSISEQERTIHEWIFHSADGHLKSPNWSLLIWSYKTKAKQCQQSAPPCSRGDPKPHLMGGCKGGWGMEGSPNRLLLLGSLYWKRPSILCAAFGSDLHCSVAVILMF